MSEEGAGSQGNTGADGGESLVATLGVQEEHAPLFEGIEDVSQLGQKYVELHNKVNELESAAPQKPESADVYKFEKPDDITIDVDEEGVAGFRETAFELGLTPEQYQKVVEYAVRRDQKLMQQYEQQKAEARDKLKAEMGAKLNENLALAKKVLRAAGEDVPEDDNVLLDDPALFKFLVWAGQKISEDHLEGTGTGQAEPRDAAEVLFGDMFNK